jgi:hypothetical protein
MSQARIYTTQLQAGLGMIPESLDLLRLWEPGMSPAGLAELAVSSGVFSRATARRARNLVVEMFAPRFLAQDGAPAQWLKFLVSQRVSADVVNQLFYLYTARAQNIFEDFVVEVYWPRYHNGSLYLSRADAELFVRRSIDSGFMGQRWSESTVKRVSGYLMGCCADFGLLTKPKQSQAQIKRFEILTSVALFLAHDLKFSGRDNLALVRSEDWRLFGLDVPDVISRLKEIASNGHFILQTGGDLVNISWRYSSMEECLNAIAQG